MVRCEWCEEELGSGLLIGSQVYLILDEQMTDRITELTGVYNPQYLFICHKCYFAHTFGIQRDEVDLSESDREIIHGKNTKFLMSVFKGNFAQAVLTSILEIFGYDVFPHGYEHNYRGFIEYLKGGDNTTSYKIRSSPDLLIFDRDSKNASLIEVKASILPFNEELRQKKVTFIERDFLQKKSIIDRYRENWGDAILTIVIIPNLRIYCKRIDEIDFDDVRITTCFNKWTECYEFDLYRDFRSLPEYFSRINPSAYQKVIDNLRNEVSKFAL